MTTKQIITTIGYLLCFLLVLLVIHAGLAQWQESQLSAEVRAYRQCSAHKASVFQGIVISRSGTCIRLNNGSRLCLHHRCWNQDRSINIGDSIYKPANTFDMYIFRQADPDSVIFVRCDFDCRTHLISKAEQDSISAISETKQILESYYDRLD